MPPRCCSQPLSSSIIQAAVDSKTKQAFLKAVAHFSTPKNARIYCPNSNCGEFIDPRQSADHKHPLDIKCQSCLTSACRRCKRDAHSIGVDCPEDWELEAVKKMGQSPSWKRCHGCHNLVNLPKGRTHMICRCKEEMCHICGAVWDPTTGCPNLCGDETEQERRRSGLSSMSGDQNEAMHKAIAQEQAEKEDAEKRSKRSPDVQALVSKQTMELNRFCAYSAQARTTMQTRHATDKLALLERHAEEEGTLQERHSKATSSLEDLQIAAEMELRATLEQTERSVKLRLKHMEAYCNGRNNDGETDPNRVVTEKNLKELGQQYSLRDGMERQHQAKINVMRDRQAKRMEELLDKHETEASTMSDKHREESFAQASRCAAENESVTDTLRTLQIRLNARWSLQLEVLCKELEEAEGLKYSPIATPAWPQEQFHVEQTAQ